MLVSVCTLNEAENIEHLLQGVRTAIPNADILVVDDDSADGTSKLVSAMAQRDPSIELIVRRNERGLGSAIRRAMKFAVEGNYQFLLNLDADLSHDPAQLPALLDRATQSPSVDVVIGSRYVAGGAIQGWPLHRRLMSRTVNRFATICLRLPVRDCSGSMRCYRVDMIGRLGLDSFRSDGYSVLEELLVHLHRHGAKMAEVPITFTDRIRGQSKLTMREALRSSYRMLALAVRPPTIRPSPDYSWHQKKSG